MAEKDPPAGDDHEKRVEKAFDSFHETLGEKADASREALQKLKEATAARDVSAMRNELHAVKEEHGWLFEEMAKHPDLAALVNELARLGL
jgi:hypothetical protein